MTEKQLWIAFAIAWPFLAYQFDRMLADRDMAGVLLSARERKSIFWPTVRVLFRVSAIYIEIGAIGFAIHSH